MCPASRLRVFHRTCALFSPPIQISFAGGVIRAAINSPPTYSWGGVHAYWDDSLPIPSSAILSLFSLISRPRNVLQKSLGGYYSFSNMQYGQ